MSIQRQTTVQYRFAEPFWRGRPHCLNVAVVNPSNGQRSPIFSNPLVDTGADHSVLPAHAALQAGLVLPSPSSFPTLGGPIRVHRYRNCTLEIEGQQIVIDVLFDPSGTLVPILGRDALLARCEFGFNNKEWMWD